MNQVSCVQCLMFKISTEMWPTIKRHTMYLPSLSFPLYLYNNWSVVFVDKASTRWGSQFLLQMPGQAPMCLFNNNRAHMYFIRQLCCADLSSNSRKEHHNLAWSPVWAMPLHLAMITCHSLLPKPSELIRPAYFNHKTGLISQMGRTLWSFPQIDIEKKRPWQIDHIEIRYPGLMARRLTIYPLGKQAHWSIYINLHFLRETLQPSTSETNDTDDLS